MIHFMRFAIERAKARDMWVVLYDEGMYPSGSSSGQVAAKNPTFRMNHCGCRAMRCAFWNCRDVDGETTGGS